MCDNSFDKDFCKKKKSVNQMKPENFIYFLQNAGNSCIVDFEINT